MAASRLKRIPAEFLLTSEFSSTNNKSRTYILLVHLSLGRYTRHHNSQAAADHEGRREAETMHSCTVHHFQKRRRLCPYSLTGLLPMRIEPSRRSRRSALDMTRCSHSRC
jgi:hypothetical protein